MNAVSTAMVLRIVVFLPLNVQSLLIRVLEPAMLSAVLFLVLAISSRPLVVALALTLVGLLLVSVVWHLFSMLRRRRQVGSHRGVLIRPMLAEDRQPSQHPTQQQQQQQVRHTHDDEASDADVGEVLPAASVPRIWQTKRPKRAEGLRAPSPSAGLEEGELYADILLDEVYSMSSSSDEDDSGSLDDDSWSSSVSSI